MSKLPHVSLFQIFSATVCFCQILFELVHIWESYHNNKRVNFLLRHSVCNMWLLQRNTLESMNFCKRLKILFGYHSTCTLYVQTQLIHSGPSMPTFNCLCWMLTHNTSLKHITLSGGNMLSHNFKKNCGSRFRSMPESKWMFNKAYHYPFEKKINLN